MEEILGIGKPGSGKSHGVFKWLKRVGAQAVRFISFSRAAAQRAAELIAEKKWSEAQNLTTNSWAGRHIYGKSDFYPRNDKVKLRLTPINAKNINDVFFSLGIDERFIPSSSDEDLSEITNLTQVIHNAYNLVLCLLPLLRGVHPLDPHAYRKLRVETEEGWRQIVSVFIEQYAPHYFLKETDRCVGILDAYLADFMVAMIKFMRENAKFDYTFSLYLAAVLDNFDLSEDGRYTIVLDEAQDLNLLQIAALSRTIMNAKKLVIVGDPDQSIYSFLGITTPYLFTEEYRTMIGLQTVEYLNKSYRFGEAIATLADAVILPNYKGSANVPFVPTLTDKRDGCIYTDVDLLDMLRPLMHKDIFVLTRTNHFRRQIERILMDNLIPFARLKDSRVMDEPALTGHYVNLSYIQHLVSNHPNNSDIVIDEDDVEILRSTLPKDGGAALPSREEMLKPMPLWLFTRTYGTLCRNLRTLSIANFLDCVPCERKSLERAWKYRKLFLTPTVRVGTIFAAKGLEAQHVFLDLRISQTIGRVLNEGEESFLAKAERRIWYTAVTRTKENLYLIDPDLFSNRASLIYAPIMNAVDEMRAKDRPPR